LRHVDLEGLAEADGVRLRGAPGRERYGTCPKCGGKDRFHILPAGGKRPKGGARDRALFFCRQDAEYGENSPGDAIDYLRWLHGVSYPQALARLGLRDDDDTGQATKPTRPRVLTDDTGLAIPDALEAPPAASWQSTARAFVERCEAALWASKTPGAIAALAYLRDYRMLEGDTIRRFRLGWHEPRDIGAKLEGGIYAARGIVIPRFFAGALWAVNVRRSKADRAEAMRRNMPDGKLMFLTGSAPRQFFNGDALADDDAAALLCAGEFDAMLAQQSAPPGVACVTPGGESYTPTFENVTMLRGRRVLIAFDADDTGTAGALRWKQHLPGATIAKPEEGKDLTDWARAKTPAILTVWLEDWLAAGQDETLTA
jgi:hypothetical protein